MATAKANPLPHLVHYVIRPALVEAKLITQKHAADAVYMATLAEELLTVEAKIAAMEQAYQLGSCADAQQYRVSPGSEDWSDANWVRAKSSELELRLRRIEQSSKKGEGRQAC